MAAEQLDAAARADPDTAAAGDTGIEIELNGQPYRTAANHMAQLVDALSLRDKMIAIAINRSIIGSADWACTPLQPGDRVDIVRAIGGG